MKKRINEMLVITAILTFSIAQAGAQDTKTRQTGLASYYADAFEGKTTANGEKYYHEKLTAAHPSLPFGTIVKVTRVSSGKTVAVRINDRGPASGTGRIIDLSRSAAERLDMIKEGEARVKITLIKKAGEPYFQQEQESRSSVYRLNISEATPRGLGIQLGSFTRLSTLSRAAQKVPATGRDRLYVEVYEEKNRENYRLIYGFFSNRRESEEARKELKQIFPDCFVVDMDE